MTEYELDGRKLTVEETTESGSARAVMIFSEDENPDEEDIESIAEKISGKHNLSERAESNLEPTDE